ncbi:MAG TPA: transporter [Rhizomicrobium sp.]|jgi:hypothetical protein
MIRALAGALIALFAAGPAWADDAELRDLCPDRPGKGTSACTVDAGHFQLEVDAFDGTFQRQDGVTTDTYFVANPTVKFGVTDNWDIEANIAPFEYIRVHDASGTQTESGIGDLFLRSKLNVTGNDGGAWGIALEPFLKIPTARSAIGNGAVEGGMLAPLSLDLGSGWSLGSTPEVDILKDESGGGYHADIINVLGIGRAFDGGVTLGAEAWSSSDLEPGGSTQSYSFDLDIAWQPESDTQLDGGINLGLNRVTPGAQVYLGVSRRF